MAKKIGTRGTYKAGNFTLNVKIKDLQDISGEGTMCLITANGAEGEEWVPLGKVTSRAKVKFMVTNYKKENSNES
jgi:hypothetical protein